MTHYVRTKDAPLLPPPASTTGIVGWLRENLFSSVTNTILTFIGLYLIYLIVPPIINWGFLSAVWTGEDGDACRSEKVGRAVGACWAFVEAKFGQIIYGRYPVEERWRVTLVYVLGFGALIPMVVPSLPYKGLNALFLLAIYPVVAFILLTGGNIDIGTGFWIGFAVLVAILLGVAFFAASVAKIIELRDGIKGVAMFAVPFAAVVLVSSADLGLAPVETSLWGGLLVTLVVAVTGIVASMPIGILLALGRRSQMPIIRLFCIAFIEFWRGVPLITVLFMSSVMLPLFLPEGVNFDKLLRVLIGVALFSAAYMAEVVRGGLQAIPRGQYEGAMALGLSYWKMMRMIVLPQALKMVIPGIVNTFIGLFKDTTLVLIVGLFDLLGIIQLNFTDPNWSTPSTSHSGYAFAAILFFVFCFGMSRYSIFMENRLDTGHRN